ncbi:MAG: PorV/PorQ family protein [Elusimicrobiota bacterium]
MTLRLTAIIVLFALPAGAESGRTAAPFLQRPMGAQAAAMGTAFTAVQDRADSLQYNPAAAGTLTKKTFTSSYMKGLGGATHGYFVYAHPTALATFSASLLYFNAGRIYLNLSDGTQTTVTAEENTAYALSCGRHLTGGLHVGATYRFIQLELAETARATTSQTDFGFLWRAPWKGFSIGGAYQFLGPDITYESAGDPSPRTLRYGAAFRFPDIDPAKIDPSVDLQEFDLTVTLDNVHVLHEKITPRAGLEIGLTPPSAGRIALRSGWIFNRETEGLTFGVGFRQGIVGLDYAFGSNSAMGSLQHFTLSIVF